jgi:hypothetical protein
LPSWPIGDVAKDGKVKLREVMDEMRAMSAGEGISKDGVQEIFDTAIVNLGRDGFGGMTHIGGLKTGREPHTVKIYFDAPNQLELKDVTPGKAPAADPLQADLSKITAEELPALFDALPADRDAWHDLRVKVVRDRPDLSTEALDQMDRAPAEAKDPEQEARFAAIDAIRAREAADLVAAVKAGQELVLVNPLKVSRIKHDWQVRATSKGFQFTMNGKEWLSIGADDHAHLMSQIGKPSRQFDPLEPSLDSGAAVDPAIAERQRQELALKAASPLRSTAEQDGTMGLELFKGDQFGMELDAEARSLLEELDADEKAIKDIKDCL